MGAVPVLVIDRVIDGAIVGHELAVLAVALGLGGLIRGLSIIGEVVFLRIVVVEGFRVLVERRVIRSLRIGDVRAVS